MECAICYEKFLTPKNHVEFENLLNEKSKNNDCNEILLFFNYLLTEKYDTSYKCQTPNCKCLICNNCFMNVIKRDVLNNEYEYNNENEMTSKYSKIKCPYCRKVDWKFYFTNNVLDELQMKLLGKTEYAKSVYNKIC